MKLFRYAKLFIPTTVFLLGLSFAACFNPASNQTNQNGAAEIEIPDSNINLTKRLEVSTRPEDVALAAKINEAIEKSEFADARWGVFAVSLKDGRVIAARDAQKLFTPASTLKIITSVVALD